MEPKDQKVRKDEDGSRIVIGELIKLHEVLGLRRPSLPAAIPSDLPDLPDLPSPDGMQTAMGHGVSRENG
jgi:hypothetical protein